MGKLTAAFVKSAPAGRHADGDGLYLLVKPSGSKSWVLRIQAENRRRDVGLGGVDVIAAAKTAPGPLAEVPILSRRILTLADAREKARLLRQLAKAGRDPVIERDRERKPIPTFAAAASAAHEALKSGWSEKGAAAFLSSLSDHAYPTLGQLRVDLIEASHVRDALAPIWVGKPEMARKVRQRIGAVLNFAKSKGWRSAEAPGRSVTIGLSRQTAGGNFAAMSYQDVPAFIAEMRGKPETMGRLALLFTIHSAARSGEVRSARWCHIDLERKLWNRPAELMKSKVAHSVTLTDDAIAILQCAEKARTSASPDAFVFPSSKGTALSDMTLSKILRDAKQPFTVHGFRSSFRDFAAEQMPTIPGDVAEAALAHVVPDRVERAYRRAQFLDMRRTLMEAWSQFLGGSSAVVKLAVAR